MSNFGNFNNFGAPKYAPPVRKKPESTSPQPPTSTAPHPPTSTPPQPPAGNGLPPDWTCGIVDNSNGPIGVPGNGGNPSGPVKGNGNSTGGPIGVPGNGGNPSGPVPGGSNPNQHNFYNQHNFGAGINANGEFQFLQFNQSSGIVDFQGEQGAQAFVKGKNSTVHVDMTDHDDSLVVQVLTNSTLTVGMGDGNDYSAVNLGTIQNNSNVTLNGGNGNDTLVFMGGHLTAGSGWQLESTADPIILRNSNTDSLVSFTGYENVNLNGQQFNVSSPEGLQQFVDFISNL